MPDSTAEGMFSATDTNAEVAFGARMSTTGAVLRASVRCSVEVSTLGKPKMDAPGTKFGHCAVDNGPS